MGVSLKSPARTTGYGLSSMRFFNSFAWAARASEALVTNPSNRSPSSLLGPYSRVIGVADTNFEGGR